MTPTLAKEVSTVPCGRLIGLPCERCPDAPTHRRLGLPTGRPCEPPAPVIRKRPIVDVVSHIGSFVERP